MQRCEYAALLMVLYHQGVLDESQILASDGWWDEICSQSRVNKVISPKVMAVLVEDVSTILYHSLCGRLFFYSKTQ